MSHNVQAELEKVVVLMYRGILRRDPSMSERQYFADRLLNGELFAVVMSEFIECDEFKSVVKSFVPPGHFYSPIVKPEDARAHLSRFEKGPVPDVLPGIQIDKNNMIKEWNALLPFLGDIPFQEQKSGSTRYQFDNPAYSWGDGSILHAMLRCYRPRRLIEIGSGWSSVCALDTIEKYLGGECEVLFVEPYPELLNSLVGATSVRTNVLDMPVQQVPLETFDTLQAGDFLFIEFNPCSKDGQRRMS